MAAKPLIAEDVRSEIEQRQKALEALTTLQRLYPGHQVVLVPNGQKTLDRPNKPPKKPGVQPVSTLPASGANRDRVANAARGKWVTIEEIIAATGLTQKQVYGALTSADGGRHYQKQNAPGEPPHGKKQYRLVEDKDKS